MAEQPADADASGDQRRGDAAKSAHAEPLKTIPIRPDFHRIGDFRCELSARVQNFFHSEMPAYVRRGYCRVFVLPDPNDPTGIWGYYTLTPASLRPENLTKSQQKRVIGGIPIPMMLIGFMGRDDRVPKEMELGPALLVDAARRVYQSEDVIAWALTLDSEGGPANNPKLFNWYKRMGFISRLDEIGAETRTMYCALRSLVPELRRRPD